MSPDLAYLVVSYRFIRSASLAISSLSSSMAFYPL